MRSQNYGLWDYVYLFLLALAVPVGIFHLVQGRYGQAVIAAGAVTIGLAFLWFVRPEVTVSEEMTAQGGRITSPATARRDRERHVEPRGPDGRMRDWLSRSVVSGFTATSVMTIVIIIGYTFVRAAGDVGSSDSTLIGWLRAMGDNTLTDSATSNLPLVLLLHFTAGIGWSLIYGALVEPRLSGPGLRRGMIFSLIPWLVSLVVFLPLTGAGFLGLDLDAGILPIIGNLILHLAYGASLGLVYASSGVLSEGDARDDGVEIGILQQSQRLMAVGLIPGAVIGAIIGLLGADFIAPGSDTAIVAVVSGAIGAVVGVLVGSYIGLTHASPDHS